MLPGHTPGGEGSHPCLLVQQACYMDLPGQLQHAKGLAHLPLATLPPWPSPSMEEPEGERLGLLNSTVSLGHASSLLCPNPHTRGVDKRL